MAYLTRTEILSTLHALPNRTDRRALTGFHLPEYQDPAQSLATYVTPLPAVPAMLGTTVYTGAADDLRHQPALAARLTLHLIAGGLVALDIHPANPTKPLSEQRLATVKVDDQDAPKPSLAALRRGAPASTVRTSWWRQVDRLITFLNRFPASATVILRLLHEMNGKHFWFGYDSTANPRARERDLIGLILDTKEYILSCVDVGILWAHSGEGRDYYALNSWGRAPGMDIVGTSLYSNTMAFPNKFTDTFAEMAATGLPYGFFEVGPDNSTVQRGEWDCRIIAENLKRRYRGASFINTWQDNDSRTGRLSLAHNRFFRELLTDPWMVNLPDLSSVIVRTTPEVPADIYTAVRVLGEFPTPDAARAAFPGEHYIHGKVN